MPRHWTHKPFRIAIAENGCWLYEGALHRLGYARVGYGGKTYQLHRLVYSVMVGPIPEGMELDHLCKVRHCCNPAHLEPVTHTENVRRGNRTNKGFCQKGHALTPDNVYFNPSGFTVCLTCRAKNRISERLKRKMKRQALTSAEASS